MSEPLKIFGSQIAFKALLSKLMIQLCLCVVFFWCNLFRFISFSVNNVKHIIVKVVICFYV